ncbi:LVIVD repeat-containing protein [Jannaschia sp. R86511]|uniref:LVIVD repeat-containing protein n=1 Tax=Jannaschia sp. R86511 TaxID=3093853 RepID=UPI0036D3FE21
MLGAGVIAAAMLPAAANASVDDDPRVGLAPGAGETAGQAISNLEKLSSQPRPAGFENFNSDLAFFDDYAVSGNYNGFNVYDVSDPAAPALTTSVLCPGSQNDVSVFGDLLFLSVETTAAKLDCTTGGVTSENRFRGVRIFDISDLDAPELVANVQTCRGSHTHTLVEDPDDAENLYVYVSGTAGVRSAAELAGCENSLADGANPSRWRIDVIKVPIAAPETSAVVGGPRIFADETTGRVDGLQNTPPAPTHPSGGSWSPAPVTDACHDITAYPAIGLAAGACEGNGILIDITDPANPERVDEVADPNFAYWHSATFNNDGTKVVFTDEWGGGGAARCLSTDRPEWGANAIFDIVQTDDGPSMELASYYKLPAPQSTLENCVAHNGNLIPVPGRDIMVQAWYQGGASVFDFTDSANPTEIAFFDRGPLSATNLQLAGFWSIYWYDGFIYGNEIGRGFDSFDVVESEHLNEVEIAAAKQVLTGESNAQAQEELTWPATFTTVRAWQSAANRQDELAPNVDANLTKFIDRAERFSTGPQSRAAANNLRATARQLGDSDVEDGLEAALLELADELG